MNEITNEIIERARSAKSAEELLKIAEENGVTITETEAAEYFEQLNKSGELSDDELDNVAGGGCGSDPPMYRCPKCRYNYMIDDGSNYVCKICGLSMPNSRWVLK